ncbi:hypothetical protein R6Z07F_013759 [Ovis aries]
MGTHSSILAWKIHGERSLAGYSPWGRKESDATERAHTHVHFPVETGFMSVDQQPPVSSSHHSGRSICKPTLGIRVTYQKEDGRASKLPDSITGFLTPVDDCL